MIGRRGGRRGRGGRRRLGVRGLGRVGLLVGLLRVVLVGAVGGRLVHLALALGRAVVRVVEPRALEVHGDGVEHAGDRRAALFALGHGRIGDLLHHLEQVPVLAAKLVDRHGFAEYRCEPWRDPGYERPMADLWNFREDVGHDRADLDGMTVEAVDGGVGSVKDVINDIDGAYLLVDPGPPILGKTVLVPAGLVTAIDVDSESVRVDRVKDEIKGAPEFEAGLGKDPAYREALTRHYSG